MSSEYLTWLARNEKPEKKRELTPKERRANWWYYNKWYVAMALAAVLALCWIVRDIRNNIKSQPDLQIGYVGSQYLPDETVLALEEQLAPLFGDLDGNGTSIVHINQYLMVPENGEALNRDPNHQMVLTTHMATGVNALFLLEDPAAFQEKFGVLALADGSEPLPGASDALWYRWADCPQLSSLPLGVSLAGDSQTLVADLCIARTFEGEDPEAAQKFDAAWAALIPAG